MHTHGTTTTKAFENWVETNVPQSRRPELSSIKSSQDYSQLDWPTGLQSESNCAQTYDKYESDILNVLSQSSSSSDGNIFSYVGEMTGPNFQVNNGLQSIKAAFVRAATISVLNEGGTHKH